MTFLFSVFYFSDYLAYELRQYCGTVGMVELF